MLIYTFTREKFDSGVFSLPACTVIRRSIIKRVYIIFNVVIWKYDAEHISPTVVVDVCCKCRWSYENVGRSPRLRNDTRLPQCVVWLYTVDARVFIYLHACRADGVTTTAKRFFSRSVTLTRSRIIIRRVCRFQYFSRTNETRACLCRPIKRDSPKVNAFRAVSQKRTFLFWWKNNKRC